MTRSIVLLASVAGTACAVAGDNLIADGGFEGFEPTCYSAPSAVGAWTVESGAIEVVQASFWQAASGDRSLDLNCLDAATMAQQTSALIVGRRYTLRFALAGNPDGEPAIKSLRVWVGAESHDLQHDTTGATFGDMGWTTREVDFVAESAAMIVRFESLTPGFYGPALDDVAVVPLTCPADVSGDAVVNFLDLNIVLGNFNATGGPGPLLGDTNADGIVNFADLNAVLASYGADCP